MGVEVFHHLKKVLTDQGKNTAVGDEGGFAPDLASNEEAVEVVLQAIEAAGYRPGEDLVITLDAAATEFFEDGQYVFRWSGGERSDAAGMVEFWKEWIAKYPIRSIEDPFDENDWHGWKALTEAVGSDVQIVGDDLFVTNVERLEQGIRDGAANAILIKVNQIGTLTETLDTMRMAREAGFNSRRLAPLGRDRGHVHRRPRGRDRSRPDQDRFRQPDGPGRQVQPAASDRGAAGRRGALPGPRALGLTMGRLKRTVVPGLLVLAVYYAVFGGTYSVFDLRAARAGMTVEAAKLAAVQHEIDSLAVLGRFASPTTTATLERIAQGERFGMIKRGGDPLPVRARPTRFKETPPAASPAREHGTGIPAVREPTRGELHAGLSLPPSSSSPVPARAPHRAEPHSGSLSRSRPSIFFAAPSITERRPRPVAGSPFDHRFQRPL